jgi:CheY-like chemotaxis protein
MGRPDAQDRRAQADIRGVSPQDRRRILVVDDSRLIRELARVGLETVGGYDVTPVESGSEALEVASAEPPEAVLLDVVMPDMDGPETLAALRAAPGTSQIPVILVTARDQPADRERFEALGVAGVITKPFEVHDLAGQVAEILGWDS